MRIPRLVAQLAAIALLLCAPARAASKTVTVWIGDDDGFGGTQGVQSRPGDTFAVFPPTLGPGLHTGEAATDSCTSPGTQTTFQFAFHFPFDATSLSRIDEATITLQSGSLARRSASATGTGLGPAAVRAVSRDETLDLGEFWTQVTGENGSSQEETVKLHVYDVTELIRPSCAGDIELTIDGLGVPDPNDRFAIDYVRLDIEGDDAPAGGDPPAGCEYTVTFVDEELRPVRGVCADGSKISVNIEHLPEDVALSDIQVTVGNPADGAMQPGVDIGMGSFRQVFVATNTFTSEPADLARAERAMPLSVTVRGEPIVLPPLVLTRPPVLMLHGLWSCGEPAMPGLQLCDDTWMGLKSKLRDLGYRETLLHAPSYPNSLSLEANRRLRVLDTSLAASLRRAREDGLAATKVDIVAHSMGGLIARRATPKEQKSIHSVLTVGTPHAGSPIADLVLSFGGPVLEVLEALPGWIPQTALEDLRVNGGEHIKRNDLAPEIPTLAIAGSACACENASKVNNWLVFAYGLKHPSIWLDPDRHRTVHDAVFRGPSDWVVTVDSQIGPITNGARTVPVLDHAHVIDDPRVWDEIALFLLLGGPSAKAASLTPSDARQSEQGGHVMPRRVPRASLDALEVRAGKSRLGVEIVSPSPDEWSAPLQVLSVTADVIGVPVAVTLVTQDGQWQTKTTPPYAWSIEVPANAFGSYTVSVLAQDSRGALVLAQRTVAIDTVASLSGIRVVPDLDPIHLNPGVAIPLRVAGSFSDGVLRDVTSAVTGTTYWSSDPGIADISPEGVLRGVAYGSATITVANGVHWAEVHIQSPVTVETGQGAVGSFVHLTGLGFGRKKGKVRLDGSTAKVISWSDEEVICAVPKSAKIGLVSVQVSSGRKGDGATGTLPSNLSIAPPFLASAVTGAVLTLEGSYFGTMRGKVWLRADNGKQTKLKIKSWTMDPQTGASAATAALPASLEPGTYQASLRNSVGETSTTITVDH